MKTSLLSITVLLSAHYHFVDGFLHPLSKITTFQPTTTKTTYTYPSSKTTSTSTSTSSTSPSRSSPLHLTETDITEIAASSEDARRLFYLWFFGGSGGGGIAVAAFPKMYDRFQTMRSLRDLPPTLGGPTVGLSPLCGYPRDVTRADLEQILSNPMTVEEMVEKGPKDSFWAEMGYLRYEAFEAANDGANPLTIRAVFDALTTSTSTVEPDTAQELLDGFRADGGKFKSKLLVTKGTGWSAIGVLVFLLGLTAYVSGEALAKGWFPDWPGNMNFPVGLVSPGVWTIPDYWI